MNQMSIIETLKNKKDLPDNDIKTLLETDRYDNILFAAADEVRRSVYGVDVYIRGLIEFSNYCKNDCYYCGIRQGNAELSRYRLTTAEILECCDVGYGLGFRTFVLQSGEDPFYTDDVICEIVSSIKKKYINCAVTLSIGERSYKSYKAFYGAGADRFLLRHESANAEHYASLHPPNMLLDNRKKCLYNLKEVGFHVGSGFMVGSPNQTIAHVIEDIRFLQELQPEMIGIGPYITHENTPFRECASGSLEMTLRLIALMRLLFPYALIPATTALGTIAPNGREQGLCAGANVVMPNLSPVRVRKQYALYNGKIHTGEEAAESKARLAERVENVGYKIVVGRGDPVKHVL